MSSFDSLLSDLTAKANADTEALKKAEREREENALRRKEEKRAKEAMIRSELTVHYRFAAKFKDMVRQSQAAVLNNPRLKKIYLGFCDYKLTRENRDTGVYIRYRFNSKEPLNKSWMKGKQPKITQIAHNNAYLHKKML